MVKQPLEVTDTTLTRHSGPNWDAIVKVITALTPILLAIMTYFTIVNGKSAERTAEAAEATRQQLVSTDSVQGVVLDTIHAIVNSQRAKLEEVNQTLREALDAAGIKQPPGTQQDRMEKKNGAWLEKEKKEEGSNAS